MLITLSNRPGRPLADDAAWLTCWRQTGDERFREAFYDVLQCLFLMLIGKLISVPEIQPTTGGLVIQVFFQGHRCAKMAMTTLARR